MSGLLKRRCCLPLSREEASVGRLCSLLTAHCSRLWAAARFATLALLWFGGLMPSIAFALAAGRGDPLQGLWYAVIVAGISFVVGLFALPETLGRRLD